MRAAIIDPLQDADWDPFVLGHRYGTIYHMSYWCKILESTFGYRPYYAVVYGDDGRIGAAMPLMLIGSRLTGRRLVALPKLPYCDVLADEKTIRPLFACVTEKMKEINAGYLEIKSQHNSEILADLGAKCYYYYSNHLLQLSGGEAEVWKHFDRSCVRQRIQKAQRSGVTVREGHGYDDLAVFYSLFNRTAEKHVIPRKPLRYFTAMWDELYPRSMLTLLIAELHGTPAAACISFPFKKTVYYEYLGLSYDLRECCAGQLLVWDLIQRASRKQIEVLDFGVCPLENEGLNEYKNRWGAVAQKIGYFYYPDVKGYKSFIKKEPGTHETKAPNLVRAGSLLLQKVLAERFYRHFG